MSDESRGDGAPIPHTGSHLTLRQKIHNYLCHTPAATQNRIAKEINSPVQAVAGKLAKMNISGQARFLEREEYFGGGIRPVMCRYWFLPYFKEHVHKFFKVNENKNND